MYTSVFSFVEKFAGSIGPTIVGVALSWAGFSATSEVTPESYAALRQATLIGVSYFPAVCATLSVVVLCFYSLSEEKLTKAREAAASDNEAVPSQ
jgi:Na+/melibiose symporter-like transporter